MLAPIPDLDKDEDIEGTPMQYDQLLEIIHATCVQSKTYVLQQVNQSLTIRNWLIGCYLVEYEQQGEDRALYGTRLLSNIAGAIKQKGIKGLDERTLRFCRSFYNAYPQIWGSLTPKMDLVSESQSEIWRSVTAKLISRHVAASSNRKEVKNAASAESLPFEHLLSHLSFSHFLELIEADSVLKRSFYEIQAVKNNWSVRDLKRAMDTLLFERVGLSSDKETVLAKANETASLSAADIVKNPYVLEFLGLEEKSEYSENDLEQAIIDHLQRFLVELGRGFCFEARQKRITFGNTHYFLDLVFYHRVLKCHVLVDLKVGAFDHADAGQMNMYLNYFRLNEMTSGDNPPVGIILCANKNDSLVEYATAGMSMEVFVSKYLVQLPSVEELKQVIEKERQSYGV